VVDGHVTEAVPPTGESAENALDAVGVTQTPFVVSYRPAVRTAFSESGNEKMMIADVPLPPKKPDTTPEVVATYCLPPIS